MNKQIKPEEVQNIPAFNYYASKEELSNAINNINISITNAIRENNKELREAIRENNKELRQEFEKMEARLDRVEDKFDKRFSIYTTVMVVGFISTLVGLYFRPFLDVIKH
jgi:hypothetical protein